MSERVAITDRGAMAKKAKDSDVPTGKLSRNYYEKEMTRLQGELVQMQLWVKEAKAKVAVLFEGRDAAGKGGVIKRITERTSPRVFRVVALPAPSERVQTQVFAQRYIERFPAGGEVCLFDRSWYNRAGVDRVMGFATERSTAVSAACAEGGGGIHRWRGPDHKVLVRGQPGRTDSPLRGPGAGPAQGLEAQPDGP